MARPTAIRPVLAMRELAAPVGSGVPGLVVGGTSSVGAVVDSMMVVGPVGPTGVVELETDQEEEETGGV